MKALATTLVAVFVLNAHAQALTMARYFKKDKGFSMEVPLEWKKQEDIVGTALVAISQREAKPDAFHENINVATGKLPQPYDSTEYARLSLDVMKKAFQNFSLEKQGDVRLGRQIDAHWFVFTHQVGVMKIKVLQYLLVKNGMGYAITCSAAPDQFDPLRALFERMANSFRIDAPEIAKQK